MIPFHLNKQIILEVHIAKVNIANSCNIIWTFRRLPDRCAYDIFGSITNFLQILPIRNVIIVKNSKISVATCHQYLYPENNITNASITFDEFHVITIMNDAIGEASGRAVKEHKMRMAQDSRKPYDSAESNCMRPPHPKEWGMQRCRTPSRPVWWNPEIAESSCPDPPDSHDWISAFGFPWDSLV